MIMQALITTEVHTIFFTDEMTASFSEKDVFYKVYFFYLHGHNNGNTHLYATN